MLILCPFLTDFYVRMDLDGCVDAAKISDKIKFIEFVKKLLLNVFELGK